MAHLTERASEALARVGKISIADYLLTRLTQLGVKCVQGVPGDFNLRLLDHVEDHPDLEWMGNCNELNAAYAADGYARVKHGLGALITTFGVGELSAINGVAGCFSERVPMIHIVGVPSTKLQAQRSILHHTLGDGRFDAFEKMSKEVSIDHCVLDRADGAGEKIDKLLRAALDLSRPVYLTLPTDLVDAAIPRGALKEGLPPASAFRDLELRFPYLGPPKEGLEKFVLDEIERLYISVQRPIVLVDACAVRFGVVDHVKKLVEATKMKFFCSPMGKSAIDEDHPQFGGVYIGSNSLPAVKEYVESSDLVINVGALKSDFNTGSFSYRIPEESTIELHSNYTQIQYAHFEGVGFKHLLPRVTDRLGKIVRPKPDEKWVRLEGQLREARAKAAEVPQDGKQEITHAYFWPTAARFLKPNDVIVAETGTSAFGLLDVDFPAGSTCLTQVLWGSIGWSVGAAFGAALAARELEKKDGKQRRPVLFVGDGSLQLTVQEISSMLRHGLHPIIFVINNEGYTIEREIHGKQRHYNYIAPWKYTGLLDVFAGGPPNADTARKARKATTRAELENVLADPEVVGAKAAQIIEVVMPKDDAPRSLLVQAQLTAQGNEG